MGLFKDVYCAECGEKTNLVMRMKLADGNYVCSKCKKILPKYIESYAGENYTIEDFKHAKQWVTNSINQYSEIFTESKTYGNLVIDIEHGLFALTSWYSKGKTPILRFSDIVDFDFAFNAKEFKEGLIGGHVTGDTHFCVSMREPVFYNETTLETGAKAKAKQSFFGNKVTYDHPKKLVEFECYFIATYIDNKPEDGSIQGDEIKQAMTFFMIDDLGATNIAGLNETREALLKAFQGGNHERQVQKINEAYELLQNKVGK